MNGDQRIRLQIDFWGLCTFVSDKPHGESPTRMDVVVVDEPHLHKPRIYFAPRFAFDQNSKLLTEDAGWNAQAKNYWDLSREVVTIRPGGKDPSPNFEPPERLDLVPDVQEAADIGMVHGSVVTNSPDQGRPVIARVELVQGKVYCDPCEVTENIWSFIPKVTEECYKGYFALWVHYELTSSERNFVIRATKFNNPANYREETLTPDAAGKVRIQVTNLPDNILHVSHTPPHSTVYYDLLQHILDPDERPLPYEVDDCSKQPVASPVRPNGVGEIGCSPIKAYRVE